MTVTDCPVQILYDSHSKQSDKLNQISLFMIIRIQKRSSLISKVMIVRSSLVLSRECTTHKTFKQQSYNSR